MANECAALDEVLFATPNFVSQYRRSRLAPPAGAVASRQPGQGAPGSSKARTSDALAAWQLTRGSREIVVAVLDDGVDVEHPLLKRNVWRNPSKSARDKVGRDFFLPDDDPDHYNPRPKKFRYPFDDMAGNDIHGTCCAGVVAASGKAAYGIAPGCACPRGQDLPRRRVRRGRARRRRHALRRHAGRRALLLVVGRLERGRAARARRT